MPGVTVRPGGDPVQMDQFPAQGVMHRVHRGRVDTVAHGQIQDVVPVGARTTASTRLNGSVLPVNTARANGCCPAKWGDRRFRGRGLPVPVIVSGSTREGFFVRVCMPSSFLRAAAMINVNFRAVR